jgi:UDP-3-O-[3-hydroxymyristoyl] glucosamine N-acyltransferase
VELKTGEIAERLKGALEGPADLVIRGVAGIREAQAGEITFVANPRYAPDAAGTKASAILVRRDWAKPASAAAIIKVDNPDDAFAEVARWFAPAPPPAYPGVHPSAVVDPGARLGDGVSVGPFCVIEAGAQIGDRTVLRAHCYVGHDARVGCDGLLYPFVSIRERCVVGDRVVLHNGVVIGSDGFGYTVDAQGVRHKIPQLGIVVVGNDVEIGANTTVDRARFGRTRIGHGVKIDNLVQIAHNVSIGDHSVIVAQAGIAGSTEIGQGVILAGQVGVAGHLSLGDRVMVGAQSGVAKDIPSGQVWRGSPARPIREMMEIDAMVYRLPKVREQLQKLSERIALIEKRLQEISKG